MGGGDRGWERQKEREKGGADKQRAMNWMLMSCWGHFLIKHHTPPPSTGHLNSNSAAHCCTLLQPQLACLSTNSGALSLSRPSSKHYSYPIIRSFSPSTTQMCAQLITAPV